MNLQEAAEKFYSLGLNIYTASNIVNPYNVNENNILKAPEHSIDHLKSERQTQIELINKDFSNSTGVGLILGYNNLMAIDIDGFINLEKIDLLCEYLGISHDYEWIIKSGSGGGLNFIFKCILPKVLKEAPFENWVERYEYKNGMYRGQGEIPKPFGSIDTNAYYPKNDSIPQSIVELPFDKMEFKWKGNLLLPPSIHKSGYCYEFYNNFPQSEPQEITYDTLYKLREKVCSIQAYQSEHVSLNDYGEMGYVERGERFIRAEPDFKIFDYSITMRVPIVIVHLNYKKIIGTHSLNKNKVHCQVAWYILDPRFNLIKRVIKNILSDIKLEEPLKSTTQFSTLKVVLDNNRTALSELLEDITHSDLLFLFNRDKLSLLKNEIRSSGLYESTVLESLIRNSGNLSVETSNRKNINRSLEYKDCFFIEEKYNKHKYNFNSINDFYNAYVKRSRGNSNSAKNMQSPMKFIENNNNTLKELTMLYQVLKCNFNRIDYYNIRDNYRKVGLDEVEY